MVQPDPGQPRTRHISRGFRTPDDLEEVNQLLRNMKVTAGCILVKNGRCRYLTTFLRKNGTNDGHKPGEREEEELQDGL